MARFSLCNLNESKPVPVPVVNCVLLTSGIFRTGAEACAYAAFSLQSVPFRSHPPESEPCNLDCLADPNDGPGPDGRQG